MLEVQIRLRYVLILIIIFAIILLKTHQYGKSICVGPRMFASQKLLRKIYAITPTYKHHEQKAKLTRLSHLFMLLPNLHWIIVEDANSTSTLVKNVLVDAALGKRATHLYRPTASNFNTKSTAPHWIDSLGLEQRNAALSWIRANVDEGQHSLVYFMDDDYAYSVDLFMEMTKIQSGRIGVWPVGLVGGLKNRNTEVLRFNSMRRPESLFPMDIAGLAIAIDLLFKYPQEKFSQKDLYLRQVMKRNKLQPLANNYTEVFVWYMPMEKTKLKEEGWLVKRGLPPSNNGIEV